MSLTHDVLGWYTMSDRGIFLASSLLGFYNIIFLKGDFLKTGWPGSCLMNVTNERIVAADFYAKKISWFPQAKLIYTCPKDAKKAVYK